jgi:hypothetical protein
VAQATEVVTWENGFPWNKKCFLSLAAENIFVVFVLHTVDTVLGFSKSLLKK